MQLRSVRTVRQECRILSRTSAPDLILTVSVRGQLFDEGRRQIEFIAIAYAALAYVGPLLLSVENIFLLSMKNFHIDVSDLAAFPSNIDVLQHTSHGRMPDRQESERALYMTRRMNVETRLYTAGNSVNCDTEFRGLGTRLRLGQADVAAAAAAERAGDR